MARAAFRHGLLRLTRDVRPLRLDPAARDTDTVMSTGFDAVCDDCKMAAHVGFLAGGGCYTGFSGDDIAGTRRALAFLFHHAYSHTVRVVQEPPDDYRYLQEEEIDESTGMPIDPAVAAEEGREFDDARRVRFFMERFPRRVLGRDWTADDIPHLRALGIPDEVIPGAAGVPGKKVALDEEQRRILQTILRNRFEGAPTMWEIAEIDAVRPLVDAGLVEAIAVEGRSYRRLELTELGVKAAKG